MGNKMIKGGKLVTMKLSEYGEDNQNESETGGLEARKVDDLYHDYHYRHSETIEEINQRYIRELEDEEARFSRTIQTLMSDTLAGGLVDDNGRYPWQADYGQ